MKKFRRNVGPDSLDKSQKEQKGKKELREEEPKEKGFRSRKLIFLGISIVLVSFGAFVVTKNFLLPSYHQYKLEKQLEGKSRSGRKDANERAEALYAIIEDITINPLGSGGLRFAVAEIALQSDSKKVIEEIENRKPELRDLLIVYLRSHTVDQLLDTSFVEESKKELRDMFNQRLNSGSIDSLYYTTLVVQ